MITIKKDISDRLHLVDEGVEYPNEDDNFLTNRVYIRESEEDNKFEAAVLDRTIIDRLLKCRFSDFSQEIKRITLYANYQLIPSVKEISMPVSIYKDDTEQAFLAVSFLFSPEDWKYLWSIREYQIEFKQIFERENLPGIFWTPEEANQLSTLLSPATNIGVSFIVKNTDTIIETEAHEHAAILSHLHELTKTSLLAKLSSESVVMQFDFPEEVRVPCEQYLLYFVQFLKDLGVEATADLQHEAGQVMFAVTPTNKDEALDKIHIALKTYLQLASSPFDSSSDPEDEIAIQRCLASIDYLKSQLRLSYMMVRTQEATIQAQEATIVRQQRALTGQVLLDSLKDVTPHSKAHDEEEVIDGILTLGQYDNKGLKVNLAEIYRRLKQLFKNKE